MPGNPEVPPAANQNWMLINPRKNDAYSGVPHPSLLISAEFCDKTKLLVTFAASPASNG